VDLFQGSRFYEKAQEAGLSLEAKRRILADRPVVRALALVREGLTKPVASPRTVLTFETVLPELAPFRSLGRLLALQQYVFLADGRVADAIDNLRLGLRLGGAVQTDTLISGLVGLAIHRICLAPLTGGGGAQSRLDQLSARDCDRLFALCQEWLAQPDPQLRVMLAERRAMESVLEDLRRQAEEKGAAAAIEKLGSEDLKPFARQFPAAPESRARLFAEIGERVRAHQERALGELRKLPWERKPLPALFDGDLAGRIASALVPNYFTVDERYRVESARMRLLAAECAIRRYRWEHDRLPGSLDELNLGDIAVDPFTGRPFQYVVRGGRHALTAAGATAPPDDPQAVNGRRPLSFTPGE
jgi:hypothetical protein